MLEGYDGSNSLLADNDNEVLTTEENQEEIVTPEITLHALIGWTMPKTMRVFAKIGSHHVIVLIDSGSTHNFISERMANLLRLPVVPTNTFSIRVANEESLGCKGRFEEVQIDLHDTHFSLTFYSLPRTRLDVVMGIQWLELLGSMVCDWKRLTMEFIWEGQTKRLAGVDGQDIQATSFKEISKEIRPSNVLFALCHQVTNMESSQTIHPSMQAMLQNFSNMFAEPSSLPPTREIDHGIPLKEGTEPVNVRPYRYAHY
jgi:hypothetical protein